MEILIIIIIIISLVQGYHDYLHNKSLGMYNRKKSKRKVRREDFYFIDIDI